MKSGPMVRRMAALEIMSRVGDVRMPPISAEAWPFAQLFGQMSLWLVSATCGSIASGVKAASFALLCTVWKILVGGQLATSLAIATRAGVAATHTVSIRSMLANSVTESKGSGDILVGLGQLHATLGAASAGATLTTILVRQQLSLACHHASGSMWLVIPTFIQLVVAGLLTYLRPHLQQNTSEVPMSAPSSAASTNSPEVCIPTTDPRTEPREQKLKRSLSSAVELCDQKSLTAYASTPEKLAPTNNTLLPQPLVLPRFVEPQAIAGHLSSVAPTRSVVASPARPSTIEIKDPGGHHQNSAQSCQWASDHANAVHDRLASEATRNLSDLGFYVLPSSYSGAASARL